MKSSARKIISAEKALTVASSAIETMMAYINDAPSCNCQGCCSCYARHWSVRNIVGGIECSPDWTGATFGLDFIEANTVEFYGSTCGGNIHSLRINVATGEMVATHDGARRSSGSIMFDFLPDEFWRENESGWILTEYRSSRPDWSATIALLQQHFGDGPTCLQEEESMLGLNPL